MLRFIIPFIGFVLLLSGCGNIPGPFQGASKYIAPEVLELQDSVGVFIEAPTKMPNLEAKIFASEIAKSLQDINIPASSTYEKFGSYILKGRVRPRTRHMGSGVTDHLYWSLQRLDGTIAGEFGTNITTSEPRLRNAAHAVAGEIAILLQEPDSSVTATEPEKMKIFVVPVVGAPGDGNAALTKSLLSELYARGAPTARQKIDAKIVVQCNFTISEPKNGKQRVKIIWIVKDSLDQEIGRSTQQNTIPAGTLDSKWGEIADDIAAGGVQGIEQILLNRK
ncbi:MAG: hypothetical protein OQJ97_12100 [Rhodospirillales bacterium]|nr:hypothetical protein [Rhodospirillales bacterium]